ncbi:MAG: hypothetical protein PHW53_00005 [Patescibacteria group bacterium]|nr:hypothetical protein [Patescibacteria group bacterium]
MKKIIIAGLFLFFAAIPAQAETVVDLHLFYGDGCPHCAKERIFVEGLGQEYEYLRIHEYEIWHDEDSQKIINLLAQESNIQSSGVPITIVGNQVAYGYNDDTTTGAKIREMVELCFRDQCPDQLGEIIVKMRESGDLPLDPAVNSEVTPIENASGTDEVGAAIDGSAEVPDKIKLPFVGEIQIRDFSLPMLTLAISLVDGFNPCAMWVLVFLISLLLGIPSIKRRWLIGAIFVLVSGFVYFLFLTAWLNIFLFIGFLFWVRIAIGIIAIAAGIHFLHE